MRLIICLLAFLVLLPVPVLAGAQPTNPIPDEQQIFHLGIKKLMQPVRGWQVFRNAKYHYEIKYPVGWPLDASDPMDVIIGVVPGEPAPGFVSVHVQENITRAKYYEDLKKNYAGVDHGCRQRGTGGSSARVMHVACPEAFAGGEYEQYLVQGGPHVFDVHYLNFQYGPERKLDHIFMKIARSFSLSKSTKS